MGFNTTCSPEVVERKHTNAKFLKLNDCAEVFHHEPSLVTELKYGLKLVWVSVVGAGGERAEPSGVPEAD